MPEQKQISVFAAAAVSHRHTFSFSIFEKARAVILLLQNLDEKNVKIPAFSLRRACEFGVIAGKKAA